MRLGEVVTLKSGGPMMTVIAISKRGACLCGWFDGETFIEHWFAAAVLNIETEVKA